MENVQLYSLRLTEKKACLMAALFIAGNLIVPQLFRLIPRGGFIFLPIYFFTLIGAYKYGWQVGLLTAVCSPLANHLLFGMPQAAMLPVIMVKSMLLVAVAAAVAYKFRRLSLSLMLLTVVGYQLLGSLFEWAYTGSLAAALQDVCLGVPGLLLQIFGGYAFIRYILKRG